MIWYFTMVQYSCKPVYSCTAVYIEKNSWVRIADSAGGTKFETDARLMSVICKLQVSFWDSIWDRCVSHICTLRFADQFLGQNLRHACDLICMLICNTKFSMGFGEQFEESQYARIHTVFLVITRKSQKLKFLPLFIP